MSILWRPAAEADRDAIVEHIARHNPFAAIALGDAIERRVGELPGHPLLYRAGRVRGTREMVVHPNYVVVYRIARAGTIEILRVLHSARQWPPGR